MRDGGKQALIGERLSQAGYRTELEKRLTGCFVIPRSDEDDGHADPRANQLLAQLEAAHACETDVEEQAVGVLVALAREIRLRGGEAGDRASCRAQQAAQRFAHVGVVVDHCQAQAPCWRADNRVRSCCGLIVSHCCGAQARSIPVSSWPADALEGALEGRLGRIQKIAFGAAGVYGTLDLAQDLARIHGAAERGRRQPGSPPASTRIMCMESREIYWRSQGGDLDVAATAQKSYRPLGIRIATSCRILLVS
jgi:hypothetical protein